MDLYLFSWNIQLWYNRQSRHTAAPDGSSMVPAQEEMSPAALFDGDSGQSGPITWRNSTPFVSALGQHLARPVTAQ